MLPPLNALRVYQELGFQNTTRLVAQLVKNPPATQEIWVQSLGWEDPLEEGVATHSSSLVYRIPWTEEPGPWGGKESGKIGRAHV